MILKKGFILCNYLLSIFDLARSFDLVLVIKKKITNRKELTNSQSSLEEKVPSEHLLISAYLVFFFVSKKEIKCGEK